MPAPIIIEVTPQAQSGHCEAARFPQEMGQAIKRGMDDAGNTAWREITIQRFSGKGPYPVSMHKLGSSSERLKQSLFYRRGARLQTVGQQRGSHRHDGQFRRQIFPAARIWMDGHTELRSHFAGTYVSTKKAEAPDDPGQRLHAHHEHSRTGADAHRHRGSQDFVPAEDSGGAGKGTAQETMIADPDNVFETLQNEIAAELMSKDLFQDILTARWHGMASAH